MSPWAILAAIGIPVAVGLAVVLGLQIREALWRRGMHLRIEQAMRDCDRREALLAEMSEGRTPHEVLNEAEARGKALLGTSGALDVQQLDDLVWVQDRAVRQMRNLEEYEMIKRRVQREVDAILGRSTT